jgi:hypothetical protein
VGLVTASRTNLFCRWWPWGRGLMARRGWWCLRGWWADSAAMIRSPQRASPPVVWSVWGGLCESCVRARARVRAGGGVEAETETKTEAEAETETRQRQDRDGEADRDTDTDTVTEGGGRVSRSDRRGGGGSWSPASPRFHACFAPPRLSELRATLDAEYAARAPHPAQRLPVVGACEPPSATLLAVRACPGQTLVRHRSDTGRTPVLAVRACGAKQAQSRRRAGVKPVLAVAAAAVWADGAAVGGCGGHAGALFGGGEGGGEG